MTLRLAWCTEWVVELLSHNVDHDKLPQRLATGSSLSNCASRPPPYRQHLPLFDATNDQIISTKLPQLVPVSTAFDKTPWCLPSPTNGKLAGKSPGTTRYHHMQYYMQQYFDHIHSYIPISTHLLYVVGDIRLRLYQHSAASQPVHLLNLTSPGISHLHYVYIWIWQNDSNTVQIYITLFHYMVAQK